MSRAVKVEVVENHETNVIESVCVSCGVLGLIDAGLEPMKEEDIFSMKELSASHRDDRNHEVLVIVYKRLPTLAEIRAAR